MPTKRNHAGIRLRHARGCRATTSSCTCSPTYEAWVFSQHDRKKIRRSFPTLAAARAWRADATVALRRGELRAESPVTVREAGDEWVTAAEAGLIRARGGERYKPSTLRSYKSALRIWIYPTFGERRLARVRRVDLQDLTEVMLAKDVDASTIRNTLMPLRAIYRRAVKREQVSVNPTVGLELPAVRGTRDRIATPDEAAALLAAAPERDRPIWAAALYAGLRRGELQALRWEDVDLSAGLIRVERAWDEKSRVFVDPKSRSSRRVVPIAGQLRGFLLEHGVRTGRRGLVFGATPESPFTASNVWRRACTAWDRAGLARINFHEARHTYASLMIAARVNAKAIATYMGHASVTTTYDRYGHLMPGNEREATDLLDKYLAANQPQW
jgi:integrase